MSCFRLPKLSIILLPVLLFAQEPPPIARVPVRLVIAPTSVTDQHGRFINGLNAEDFTLYDNDVLQQDPRRRGFPADFVSRRDSEQQRTGRLSATNPSARALARHSGGRRRGRGCSPDLQPKGGGDSGFHRRSRPSFARVEVGGHVLQQEPFDRCDTCSPFVC